MRSDEIIKKFSLKTACDQFLSARSLNGSDQSMKVVLVGDSQVGKTCIITHLVSGTYRDSMPATIGAAFQTHTLSTTKGIVTLQIWDTAGQEKYRALAPMYYRSAEIALLVFDVTNRDSFDALEQWIHELSEKAPAFLQVVIAANKIDLKDDRVVSKEVAERFAERHNVKMYAEVSAKTGEGIVDLFSNIAVMTGKTDLEPRLSKGSPTEAGKESESNGCC
jgi:small GTP-binding protein